MKALKAEARLYDLHVDIRQMAAEMVAKDDKIDTDDVRAMMQRATSSGHLTEKGCRDLAWVREKYKDKFTRGAMKIMTSVLSPFIQEQLKQMKETQRRKKIDRQILEIEDRIELLRKDRKLRDLDADLKTRVVLTNFFGKRRADA